MSTSIQRYSVTTADGSTTLYVPQWNEHYHSVFGAVQESKHIFIKEGLVFRLANAPFNSPLQVLEIGLGTGLNAFLTAQAAKENSYVIDYTAIEAYPITPDELAQLNFSSNLSAEDANLFNHIHDLPWESMQTLSVQMRLRKLEVKLENWQPQQQLDLIYFDAFAPAAQPELWTAEVFKKLFEASSSDAVLVTYCVKGIVRRAMQSAGWLVSKIPGPPGKREITRAIRP